MGNQPLLSTAGGPAAEKASPFRVLVTGFHDWASLGSPPHVDLWRAHDNPTARLIRGPCASVEPGSTLLPAQPAGPLVQQLRGGQLATSNVLFRFVTLSTCWCTSNAVDYEDFDVVVHLGVGVYDSHSRIMLEDGAFNKRRPSPDAAQLQGAPRIDPAAGDVLEVPPCSRVLEGLDGLRIPPGFELQTVAARPENSYICNETHWRALTAVAKAWQDGPALPRPRAAFFVHTPHTAPGAGDEPLAEAVAGVVERLVERSRELPVDPAADAASSPHSRALRGISSSGTR